MDWLEDEAISDQDPGIRSGYHTSMLLVEAVNAQLVTNVYKETRCVKSENINIKYIHPTVNSVNFISALTITDLCKINT